jgi:uncharacterized protein
MLNLLIFFLLTAGHCELVVTLINRLHALRLPVSVLKQSRRVHDVVMPLFPVLLVWRVGIAGPALLRGGSWANLSAGWAIYLGLCTLGAAMLLAGALRWLLRKNPAALLSNHSETIDVARALGRKPIGRGRYQVFVRLPGNEVFRLQLNEKTFCHPRLPAEWDGLSILHLSDAHFLGTIARPYFEHVFERLSQQPADLVVFTGDLFDNLDLADWLPATFGRLDAPLGRFFILGNHDWYLDDALIRGWMGRLGWTDVAGRVVPVEHRGRTLAIGGSEVPWMGPQPDFSAAPPATFRLLLSHTPDNLPFARENGVDLMLSGHNHGGQIVLPVLGPVYSPSRFGVKYAAGTFDEPPTLLHVSRGLSGRYPLRWKCLPEATKIVLRKT